RAHREAVSKAVLLDVVVGRLTTWTAPGVLLIGDAAHPMSPIAAQGINMALRDAVVAANHLVPALLAGADAAALDAAARQVEAVRVPEIIAIQEIQRKQGNAILGGGFAVRLALRLMPWLVRLGLVRWMPGLVKRRKLLNEGVVPVRLTV